MRRSPFALVKRLGSKLPNVEASTRYDGAEVLKVAGVFMAGEDAASPARSPRRRDGIVSAIVAS